jgi:hypothetical protein
MKRFLVIVLILILNGWISATDDRQKKEENIWRDFSVVEKPLPVPEDRQEGFNSIRSEEAAAYLKFLASDLLQGRETATDSFDIAAEFAATFFRLWGIKPAGDLVSGSQKKDRSYFQEIPMKETLKSKGKLTVRYSGRSTSQTRTFYPEIDYSYYATGNRSLTAPVVFVGFGISEKKLKYDDYRGVDIEGKIVMILTEFPGVDNPKSPFNDAEFKRKYLPMQHRHRLSPKISLAKKRGALAVLLVENSPGKNGDVAKKVIASRKINDEKPIFSRSRKRLSLIEKSKPMPWEVLPYIRISRELADTILGFGNLKLDQLKTSIDKNLAPRSRELASVSIELENQAETRLVRSRNVLGFISGSDPVLKDEVVVIGAHLDHLGQKGDYIFNGADDNGSGSVAVMEIAQAFSKNMIKPKRSVLFALWTGEESGLIGSRYYVQNPGFPIQKTVACLNLDMVSRGWTLDSLKRINRMWRLGVAESVMGKINFDRFVSLIIDANSPMINRSIQSSNRYMGLTVYSHKSKSRAFGSDHSPFAMLKVPWIFYAVAPTKDYHEPSDSLEKVDFKLIEKYARLTYLMAFELANQ